MTRYDARAVMDRRLRSEVQRARILLSKMCPCTKEQPELLVALTKRFLTIGSSASEPEALVSIEENALVERHVEHCEQCRNVESLLLACQGLSWTGRRASGGQLRKALEQP